MELESVPAFVHSPQVNTGKGRAALVPFARVWRAPEGESLYADLGNFIMRLTVQWHVATVEANVPHAAYREVKIVKNSIKSYEEWKRWFNLFFRDDENNISYIWIGWCKKYEPNLFFAELDKLNVRNGVRTSAEFIKLVVLEVQTGWFFCFNGSIFSDGPNSNQPLNKPQIILGQ